MYTLVTKSLLQNNRLLLLDWQSAQGDQGPYQYGGFDRIPLESPLDVVKS